MLRFIFILNKVGYQQGRRIYITFWINEFNWIANLSIKIIEYSIVIAFYSPQYSAYKRLPANLSWQSNFVQQSTMSIKLQILFVVCIIYIYAVDVANGRPDPADTALNSVEDTGLDVTGTSGREKRLASECAKKGGCHQGYCWASCSITSNKDKEPEWCYTTKTYSQSYSYIKCSSDSECSKCLKCAGPCSFWI